MSALLLLLLMASAPGASGMECHWRQTGACSKSGPRQPKNDKSCSATIAKGASGFCDCNGNGFRDGYEPGYDCKDSSPNTCDDGCKTAAEEAAPQSTPSPPEATPAPTPEATKLKATPAPTPSAPTPAPPPTPPPANYVKHYRNQFKKFDVFNTFKLAINNELENSKCPPAIAAIALVFGFVFLFSAEKSFNYGVTLTIAIVFGIIAKQSVKAYWQEHNTQAVSDMNTVANLAGLEVGLVVAVGAHYGNKGMLVTIGAAAGFFVAHFVSEFLVQNFQVNALHQVEFQVVWYSVICLAASYAVYKDKHLGLMAFLSPIPGGVFTASALLYFVTEAFVGFSCKHGRQGDIWHSGPNLVCPHGLTPKTGQWISFFHLAFDHTRANSLNDDVGIFYNSTWNFMNGAYHEGQETQGYMILVDHVVSVALWVILTLIGIKIQRGAIRMQAAAKQKTRHGANLNTVLMAAGQGA